MNLVALWPLQSYAWPQTKNLTCPNSDIPTDSQQTPITTQLSTSKPQKKQSRRKQRKDIKVSQYSASTEPITVKETNEESVPTHSYDPSQSGEDRIKLHELMNLCTKLSDRVLALETTKTTQALEIASLKSRVGSTRRVESSNDEGLGTQEDASKQGRSIEDINKDAEVSLVDETQGRSNDTEMFDTDALIGDEVFAENDMTEKEHYVIPKEVSAAKTLTTAGIKIPVSIVAPSTTAVSPPVITEVEYAGETATRTPTSVSSSSIKDKGKAKMIEPEVPLNKKDQIRLDEELERMLDAKEKEAARLERENEQEQGELTIEEKSKLFMELMNERKRHFAKLRAKEKRRKPLTKEIQKAFDKTMDLINNFKPMDSKAVKRKLKAAKRNQLDDKETDEHEEAEEDDEAEMKKHMEIVQDKEEIAIDDIPLATKPPMIIEYKIVKEGQKGFYHLIRADGSSKRPEDDYERVFWGDLKVEESTRIQSDCLEAV
ncbi:hypothetical protein Tco_1357702 [Tanacetum coccineum]